MGFQVQIQHYIKVTQTDYVPVFFLVAVWISRSTCFHMCCAINFNTGSNINEVIKVSFNLFIFFSDKISQVQKSTKKHKKALKSTKKYKNTTNLRFIDIRFINLKFIKLKKHEKATKSTTNLRFINSKFIDVRFINLKFIDIRFICLKLIKLKKHLSGNN